MIDAAYGEWLAEGLSPATVSKYHAILSAALRQAVKWDWIDRAPTDRATPPSLVRREMVVPTPEQLMTLVTAAEKSDPVLASSTGSFNRWVVDKPRVIEFFKPKVPLEQSGEDSCLLVTSQRCADNANAEMNPTWCCMVRGEGHEHFIDRGDP